MSNKIESREKLVKILTEMFQFDQADLDFGIYRIMNQKRDRIEEFMNEELFSKIEKSIEPLKSNINQSKVSEIENKISTLDSMNDDGSFDNKIMELKEEMEGYTSSSKTDEIESEIYSHLTDFFRRYYDEGDFISQRRYKDGVYAIPYEGEEVKLHWANYDQYYIKSSEYFYDYSFKTSFGKKVNFKLLDVETEKDNNKGDKKTFQIIGDIENNPELIDGELYIYFQYTEDKTTQKRRNEEAVNFLIDKINNQKLLNYEPMLRKGKRGASSEIEKQINRYTARNTYDYFIHKDLKGFLTRELDFYIKNEVLHLENMNPEETEKLKEYITKAKVIESIANIIITFLAQLEEFQKGLWLKKKFVVETNYAITLDRVDEKFYSEIINNDEQIEEWIKLFAIDELDDYSEPLTIGFLKNNPYLMLDTKFFDSTFKEELIGSIDNLDESIDGVLINSDNFHALNLIQERYREKIDCVYIDPPYNTDGDGFLYKDSYRESSWLSMMFDRIKMSKTIQSSDSVNFQSIGNEEYDSLSMLNKILFDNPEKRNVIHWKKNQKPQNASGTISESAEYILVNFGTKLKKLKRAMSGTREDDKGSFKPSPLFKFDGRERRVQVIPKGTIVEAKIWEKGKLSGVRNKLAYIEILDEPNVINGILQNDVRIKGEWTKTDTYGEYSKMVSEGRLFINSNGFPNEKAYRDENSFNVHTNLWTEFGYNEKGKELLDNLFGVSDIIKYPKPVELLNEVVRCSTENNSII